MNIIEQLISLPREIRALRHELSFRNHREQIDLRLELAETQLKLQEAERLIYAPEDLTEAEQAHWLLTILGKHSPGKAPSVAINRQLEIIQIDRINRWGKYGSDFALTKAGTTGHDGISDSYLLEVKSTTNGNHSVSGDQYESLFHRVTKGLTKKQREKCLFSLMHHKHGNAISHLIGPLLDLKKLADSNGYDPLSVSITRLREIGFVEVVA